MKRDGLGAATSATAAGPFISAPAVPVSLGPAVVSPAELVVPTTSAGEIDGDSTAGRSILGCGCPDALSEFATVSAPAASIALRFSIAYILGLAVHQSVTMFGLPIGYRSVAGTGAQRLSVRRGACVLRRPSHPMILKCNDLDRQSVLCRKRLQRYRRPRADLLNDFGRSKPAEPGGCSMILPARQTDQKARSKKIAGSGHIDDFCDRFGTDGLDCVTRYHHATFFTARDHRKSCVVSQRLHGGFEVGSLVKAVQLTLVGENNVDNAFADEVEKFSPIPVDTESVRQGQRDTTVVLVSNLRRLHESFLGLRRIPQVSFEIGDRRGGNLRLIDIGRPQVLRRAQIRVHGALAIRGHHDVAARRRRTANGRFRLEGNVGRTDIVDEGATEIVVPDLADKACARAEAGNADDCVCRRPT